MAIVKGLLSPLPVLIVVAGLLLGPAGLVSGVWVWPRAWAFLIVLSVMSIAGQVALAVAWPASFAVRQQGVFASREKRQPLIDAVGSIVYALYNIAWFGFIPLDVFRLRLLEPPVGSLSNAGAVLAVAGIVVTYVAIAQNQFAAPSIHDQRQDGQRVIDSGLYAVVRHPFYAGMLLIYSGTALWLGSYAALVGAAVFLVMTLARTVIEERYLRQTLPAYADYARRVRGRLVPYLL